MNFDQQRLIKSLGIAAGIGAVVGIVSNIPLIGLACCCLGWLIAGSTGVLYGYFADQDGEPVDMGTWIAGGAAAGAVGGFVNGLIGGIITLIFTALGMGADMAAQLAQLEQAGVDVPPELAGSLAGGAAGGIASVITGICAGFIVWAVLAAIGGAIYAFIQQGQNKSSAPAV